MNNEQYDNQEALAMHEKNEKYMEVANLMATMPQSNTQAAKTDDQKQQSGPTYVYVNGDALGDELSKVTLDRALIGGPDDDIPSKLFLPPSPNGAVGRHLEKSGENDQDLARYRLLMRQFYQLTAAQQAAENEDDDGFPEPQQQSPGTPLIQEYPSNGLGPSNQHPASVDQRRESVYSAQDLEQPLIHDEDPEVLSNEVEEEYIMGDDEGDRQQVFRSSSSPLASSSRELFGDEPQSSRHLVVPPPGPQHSQQMTRSVDQQQQHHQQQQFQRRSEIEKLEDSFDMVPVSDKPRGFWQNWLVPSCCFLGGILVAIGILILFNFLDLEAFGYEISIDSTKSESDDRTTSLPNTTQNTTQNPTSPPTTSPPTTSAPTFSGPPPEPLSLSVSEELDSSETGFGSSVAVMGMWLGVGAPGSSRVSIFQQDAGSMIQLPDLEGVVGSAFGADIDVGLAAQNDNSGDALMIVGAPENGAAYLYSLQSQSGSWEPLGPPLTGATQRLRRLLTNAEDRFGAAVSLEAGRAAVGAPLNDDSFENSGSVYVVHVGQSDFTLRGTSANARFGEDVSISPSGNTIAVGEPGQSSFVIFEWNGSDNWERVFRRTFSQDIDFGSSVNFLSENFVAIGAPSFNSGGGRLRFFQRGSQNLWMELPSLAGNQGDRVGAFGTVSGTEGDHGPEIVASKSSGDIKRYDLYNGEWRERFVQGNSAAATSVAVSENEGEYTVFAGFSEADRAVLYKVQEQPAAEDPTSSPSSGPTTKPTPSPTVPPGTPTFTPSTTPPTHSPSSGPSGSPTSSGPSGSPTTLVPTDSPTESPTPGPTESPTPRPTVPPGTPTFEPSYQPSDSPTEPPSPHPTGMPSQEPSDVPTLAPSQPPSHGPTNAPSAAPITDRPTVPEGTPTMDPTSAEPTSAEPTGTPTTMKPTFAPAPSDTPTLPPTPIPTTSPSFTPTFSPTGKPTVPPTNPPTTLPTLEPTLEPTPEPTTTPTTEPQWTLVSSVFTGSGLNTGHGSSISLAGGFMAVGEPKASSVGQVGIYGSDPSWSRLASTIDLGAKSFGSAVDLAVVSGQPSLLVGAKDTKDVNGIARFGSVAYYEFDNAGVWTQLGSTQDPGSVFFDAAGDYGGAVAMASDIRRFAVAAPDSSLNSSEVDTGKIYTYDFDGTDWLQMTSDPIIGVEESMLGSSIDMSKDGSRLLAGAPSGRNGDGAVFYYEWNDGEANWDQIVPYPGGFNESLGTSVAIISDDGSMIAMGGPNKGNDEGVIRVYQQKNGLFQPIGSEIVGLSGQRIGTTLTGAQGRIAFGTDTGSFRVYEFSDGWNEVASGPDIGSAVVSISISDDGNTVAVGLANETSMVYNLQ